MAMLHESHVYTQRANKGNQWFETYEDLFDQYIDANPLPLAYNHFDPAGSVDSRKISPNSTSSSGSESTGASLYR